MRRQTTIVLLVLVCLPLISLLPEQASSVSYVGGIVSGLWTQGNGPYVVLNDVLVPEGQSLTIEAGVIVKFDDDRSLFVEGTLVVDGSQADPVIFTSNSSSPARASWWVIQLNETSNETSSVVRHARIEYALFGIVLRNVSVPIENTTFYMNGDGVRLVGSSAKLSHNAYEENFFGVTSLDGSNASIEYCTFLRNVDTSIFISNSSTEIVGSSLGDAINGIRLEGSATARIRSNHVADNSGCGVCVSDQSHAIVSETTLTSNRWGIRLADSTLYAENVDIDGSEIGLFSLSSLVQMDHVRISNNSLYSIRTDNSVIISLWNSSLLHSDMADLRLGNGCLANFFSVDFNQSSVVFDNNNSKLTVHWFLTLEAQDLEGSSISESTIIVSDNENGTFQAQLETNASGVTDTLALREYGQSNSTSTYYTPYWIRATKEGYEDNETYVDLDRNTLLIIRQRRLNNPPSVVLNSPEGGEELKAGSRLTIEWTAQDDHTAFENLTFYVNYTCQDCEDGGMAGPLVGVDSLDWLIPDSLADHNVSISVDAVDEEGLVATGESGWIHVAEAGHTSWWAENLWILIGVVIIAVMAVILLLLLRKRSLPAEDEETASEEV